MKKYIFVTGGVTSSLGKGIISASLGLLLKAVGYKVTIQKFDPYLNIDPGTMSPYEHGECYVTEDGAETDLDLGHYERFLGISTSQDNNVTTGRIYNNVISNERKGAFLGKTVQVIPHITDEIKNSFYKIGKNNSFEIIITEIGGCIGDIESLPFFEAVRQAKLDLNNEDFLNIHLTLIPYLSTSGELKTKPTQHSVKKLLEAGIQPDILVCRSEHKLGKEIKNKLALFCNVSKNSVIESIDAKSIYDVPVLMREEGLEKLVLENLNLKKRKPLRLSRWISFLNNLHSSSNILKIAIVGKYVELHDAYKSISESLIHAGANLNSRVEIKWILSEKIKNSNVKSKLRNIDGVIVAPGFGERGVEGKISSIKYVRENNVPFFGICLGMQLAIIEIARNILNLKDANSTEFSKTLNPVIGLMTEWYKNKMKIKRKIDSDKGGTMRLGSYPCIIDKKSLAYKIYGKLKINERHRHRYEINSKYTNQFKEKGYVFSGRSPDQLLPEILESLNHSWFLGVQFHPELKSRPFEPHPLFISFVKACINNKK